MSLLLDRYSKLLEKQVYMQGVGRHSIEDVRKMIRQVLAYLTQGPDYRPFAPTHALQLAFLIPFKNWQQTKCKFCSKFERF